MGIYKRFDEEKQKWYWEGFGFKKYYNSEEECDADQQNVWKEHNDRLKAHATVIKMLMSGSRHQMTY